MNDRGRKVSPPGTWSIHDGLTSDQHSCAPTSATHPHGRQRCTRFFRHLESSHLPPEWLSTSSMPHRTQNSVPLPLPRSAARPAPASATNIASVLQYRLSTRHVT